MKERVPMIYLDYAANTPVDVQVLDEYYGITKEYFANPNAKHQEGIRAKVIMEQATRDIVEILQVTDKEVIYTSGASEANNLGIKGVARAYRENGKHIISTCLEHSSVSACLSYLQSMGYEVDLVDIKTDGTVDIDHLKQLIRQDTVLVTVCYVDSELGTIQPISEIANLLQEYPNCFFHVDATQAIGKVPVNFEQVDLVTFAPHKFYGLNGMGVLLRNKEVTLSPLISGGSSTSIYRSGTPVPAQASSTRLALHLAIQHLDSRIEKVGKLNKWLVEQLQKYPEVRINSPVGASCFFLNLSVKGILSEDMQRALDQKEVYVSTKSACLVPKLPSRAVFAVTRDKKNAKSSFRISLSHLTTKEELQEFIEIFDVIYKNFGKR